MVDYFFQAICNCSLLLWLLNPCLSDDTDTVDTGEKRLFNLKPIPNQPIPTKPANEIPQIPMKPSLAKKPPPPMKPSRDPEENASGPSFVSQVKLKPVLRPSDSESSSSTNDHKQEFIKPGQARSPIKSPFLKRDPSPPVGSPSNQVPPKPSRAVPVISSTSNEAPKPPVKPTPVPRPVEKKSFLHAFMGEHPEMANQRIPKMLVPF